MRNQFHLILLFCITIFTWSCKNGKTNNANQLPDLSLDESINPIVREAIKAWQQGRCDDFLSYFVETPIMKDGKNEGDFKNYVINGCGREGFIRIDKVSPDGLTVQGPYRTFNWGEIPTYLHFELNSENKIELIEIGEYKN